MKNRINYNPIKIYRFMIATSAILALLLTTSAVADGQKQYTLTDLGNLGGGDAIATAVNNDGAVVGWSTTAYPISQFHAFLWQEGVMSDIGTLGGGWSEAMDINDMGIVVGTSSTEDGEQHAFYYYNDQMIDLNDVQMYRPDFHVWSFEEFSKSACWLPPPTFIVANAVNQDGSIVGCGSVWGGTDMRGFLLVPYKGFDPENPAFTFYDLGWLPHAVDDCQGLGVNRLNQVVGVSGNQAFIWEDLEINYLDLSVLPVMRDSCANDINDSGYVAGWSSKLGPVVPNACVWYDGYRIDLGVPNSAFSEAVDINNMVQIVGWTVNRSYSMPGLDALPIGYMEAMLWDGFCLPIFLNDVTEFPISLDSSGPIMWDRLEAATGITEDGRIVGYGIYTHGNTGAFMLSSIDSED